MVRPVPAWLRLAVAIVVAISLIPRHDASASGVRSIPFAGRADAADAMLGTVVHVTDGDTVTVLPDPQPGVLALPERVRILGIQAIEMTTYSDEPSLVAGECMAVPAYQRLRQLTFGKQVKVSALYPSAESRGRPLRSVAVVIGGRWQDVGEILVAEGLALPMPSKTAYFWNYRYQSLAQRARDLQLGVFNPRACGVGPHPEASLTVSVQPMGNGNREFAEIVNATRSSVDLSGWYLRDSGYHGPHAHGFTFARGTVLRGGSSLRVYVGRGRDRSRAFFMGLYGGNIFNEPIGAPQYMGDGAYLFDPLGNLRASVMYPEVTTAQATDTEPVER